MSAAMEVETLIQIKLERRPGITRAEAHRQVMRENEELRQRFVAEANAAAGRRGTTKVRPDLA